jgi:hypothetical protein
MMLDTAVSHLDQAIARVRPMLHGKKGKDFTSEILAHRTIILWAAAKAARHLGASDVVHDSFMQLATEIGLINVRGYWLGADVRACIRQYGAQDMTHCINWALQGRNPFATGGC